MIEKEIREVNRRSARALEIGLSLWVLRSDWTVLGRKIE